MRLLAVLRTDELRSIGTALLWATPKGVALTKITSVVCSTADAKDLTSAEVALYLTQARQTVQNLEEQLGITGPRGISLEQRLDLLMALGFDPNLPNTSYWK